MRDDPTSIEAALFDLAPATDRGPFDGCDGDRTAPLAVRMRPRSVEEFVGQGSVLREGSALRSLAEGSSTTSVLLYGPPGTGKTTLARLASGGPSRSRRFVTLLAQSSGVKELREVLAEARRRRQAAQLTILFIDEIHRYSTTQQDALLGAVEEGEVVLVAATTENPSFSVTQALLSRMVVVQLRSLSTAEIHDILRTAVSDDRGLAGTVELSTDAGEAIARLAGGDARKALTRLELSAAALAPGTTVIDIEAVERTAGEATVRYDRQGDQHYDVISAFIKSIRGSDPDAALHYLARMLVAGEDPRFIARRLLVHATEDVGLADPSALNAAVAAAQTAQLVGMPEARLALAQATIHLSLAPKSNAVISAIDRAMADVRAGNLGEVPPHLRQGRYKGAKELGNAVGYRHPHRVDDGVLEQQYPPDPLVGRNYYEPTGRGWEQSLGERLARLRETVRRGRPPAVPQSPDHHRSE